MREAIGRRGFIAGATLGATALASGPTRAAGTDPEVTWRLTSSFPKSLDLLYGGAESFAREVGQITDGRFRIDVSPPGDIVPGLQAFDAVQAGTVEACQTLLDYEYGKDPAFAIPTAIPFGPPPGVAITWVAPSGATRVIEPRAISTSATAPSDSRNRQ